MTDASPAATAAATAEAAAEQATIDLEKTRERSRSRSHGKGGSSSSSSSSSSPSRSTKKKKDSGKFSIDDRIEAHGLTSESSKPFNGRLGRVLQYMQETGRYEVKFGPDSIVLLRPDCIKLAALKEGAFAVDDVVEVHSLESETGQKLNGQRGVIIQLQASGRYEVQLGGSRLTSLKPENLRFATAKSDAGASKPKEQPKAFSLAGMLGMGRKEEEKKVEEKPVEQYQSVWERNGTGPVETYSLTEEEREAINILNTKEENRNQELAAVRRQVEAEFFAAGIFDRGMIEEAYKQALEEHDLRKLLLPQEKRSEDQGSDSSSSSSSSSSSRSASRSRSRSSRRKDKSGRDKK